MKSIKIDWKKVIPHLIVIAVLMIISAIYFSPVLEGYVLKTHDLKQYKGMSKEIVDFRKEYNEEPLWTNSMFGGMPADQISVKYDSNLVSYIYDIYTLWMPRPISYLWTILIGFYILLMCLKVDPWIALVGSLAFGFSSFFMISLQAGHMTKVCTIGLMSPTIGGFILLFRGYLIKGGVLASIFLSMQLWAGHPQITYYTFFIIGFVGLFYISKLLFKKEYKQSIKIIGLSFAVVLISLGSSMASLWSTFEYGKETIRGESELTIETPDNIKRKQQENPGKKVSKYRQAKNGLDNDYILAWSYGTGETFTFMFPNLKGGGNNSEPANTKTLSKLYPSQYEEFEKNVFEKASLAPNFIKFSNQLYNSFIENKQYPPFRLINQMPASETGYFGQQGLTNGPVFIGIILCFLCFLTLIISDGKYNYYLLGISLIVIILAIKQMTLLALFGLVIMLALSVINKRIIWFLFTVLILTIFLSWGKNYLGFSEFFIEYFPLYNKFRSVTMILVVAELLIPLIGILFLVKLIQDRDSIKLKLNWIYISAGLFALFLIIVSFNPETFFNISDNSNYLSRDQFYYNAYLDQNQLNNIKQESNIYFDSYKKELFELRKSVIQQDALKGFAFVCGVFLLILLFIKEKIKKHILLVGVAILIMIEMVPVAKTYLNNEKDAAGNLVYWIESDAEKKPYNLNAADLNILKMERSENKSLDSVINEGLKLYIKENEGVNNQNDLLIKQLSLLNANTNYRVYSNLEGLTSGTRTSYFHKSIGGYHGAKLMRYQEIIDFHIINNNQKVLDMLNTKYEIVDENYARHRKSELGPAWIVNDVRFVDSANHEMEALKIENGFDPKNIAVIDKRYKDIVGEVTIKDPASMIEMIDYKPNKIEYNFSSGKDELVVFSEIFYDGGWQAYIDDKPVDHIRANYLLRGLKVPSGNHKIRFEFSRSSYSIGSVISLISSLIIILLGVYLIYLSLFKENSQQQDLEEEVLQL